MRRALGRKGQREQRDASSRERVRILFFDRDGTLNRSLGGRPPNTPAEVDLLPGVTTVVKEYVAQGWLLVIVSNQGGVASGYIREEEARAVQQRVIELLPVPVAASYLCPHMPGGSVAEYAVDCPNRKPRPGFILTALEQLGARAEDCLFVGDSSTDRLAAQAAGVTFRWADLFFGRPIDRGMQLSDGRWVQISRARHAEWVALGDLDAGWGESVPQPDVVEQSGSLALVGRIRGATVGWLSLVRGETEREADLAFGVDPALAPLDHGAGDQGAYGPGVGALLLSCALDWAQAQPGLERLCVQVHADNLPVSRLCCRYGFEERRAQKGGRAPTEGRREGWIQLDCSL
jgi:D-glycero-D-manno-heptose 1,7-bisphosphate phosphatase